MNNDSNLVSENNIENSHNLYGNVQHAMATGGQRFANYIIDTIMVYILLFIFTIGGGIIAAIFFPDSVSGIDENSNSFSLIVTLLFLLVGIVYYTFMESVFGRTIGKFITGTCVVNSEGRRPEPGALFLRSLSRHVPFEAFSFLGENSRGWHDQWTDTWVVEKRYEREIEH